jgi:hypothetical protein
MTKQVWVAYREEDGAVWHEVFSPYDAANAFVEKVIRGSWASYNMEGEHGPLPEDPEDTYEFFHECHDRVVVGINQCIIRHNPRDISEVLYG